jgi:Ca2+-transporting ATPase
LNRDTLVYIGFIGILIAIVTCGIYVWAISHPAMKEEAKTMFFLTLIFARLFNGFNCRSLEQSVLRMKFLGNKVLLISAAVSVIMSLIVITVPVLQQAFETVGLTVKEWSGLLFASFFVLLVVEMWKRFIQSYERKAN